MSKVITSPVSRFPGTVTLSDPLTLPQAIAMEQALEAVRALESPSQKQVNYTLLSGLCKCVERWEIKGYETITPDTFPATPPKASATLAAWLLEEVIALYQEAEEIPNE